MKTHIPSGQGGAAGRRRSRFLRALGRLSPFVFPWSPLQRMTGAVVSDSIVTLAQGRLNGRDFDVDGSARWSGTDLAQGLKELDYRSGEPVCVSLPRNLTLIRNFRVPAESDTEIEAMLPHLLSGELPMSIEHVSWVWVPLQAVEAGFTLVAVYVARNDRLNKFLSPLVEAGLNIVGLIPEGWGWAHGVALTKGGDRSSDASDVRSIVVMNDGVPQLVVESAGQALFDVMLPLSACRADTATVDQAESDLLLFDAPIVSATPDTIDASTAFSLDWDGPGFAEARQDFESLLGFPLPEPEIWPEAQREDGRPEPESFFFAASVAATGLSHQRLMIPREFQRGARRRTAVSTLARLAWLGALAAAIWLVLAVFEDGQTRRYLALLEQQIQEEAPRVEVLAAEYNVIRESNREHAGGTEVLQVLDSLRRHVKTPTYLEHLDYVQGSGVTLRGGAPTSANVLEMTEELATDPLWQGLRVMQLRSEKLDGLDQVHFVVEGQLN